MTEMAISPLRRRMIEDVTVRNFVEKMRNDRNGEFYRTLAIMGGLRFYSASGRGRLELEWWWRTRRKSLNPTIQVGQYVDGALHKRLACTAQRETAKHSRPARDSPPCLSFCSCLLPLCPFGIAAAPVPGQLPSKIEFVWSG